VQVLVIEDDVLAMAGLSSLLTSWGATVYEAGSSASALLMLEHLPVLDLIISDYRLPGSTDGLALIGQIRAAVGAAVPACLVSGDADAGLLVRAQEAQLTLLQKPVRPAKLRSLIRRLLRESAI
jgi:CheY-like chemotaxis protein